MVISVRDGMKLFGVVLICACAAFVCCLFLSYMAELQGIAADVAPGPAQIIYDAQLATSKVVISVTGGCLVSTAVVVLCFYINQYIVAHGKELGVLKALGWTRAEISRGFAVFGLSAFAGGLLGWSAAVLEMPAFMEAMNEDGLLPALQPLPHPELLVYVAVLPGISFALFAVLYAARRLRTPALSLIRGLPRPAKTPHTARDKDAPFLVCVRKSIMRTSRSLAFFVFIGSFCFSCMLQMSASMNDLASELMSIIMLIIGIVLAVTCLVLSTTSAVQRSMSAAAIMHACGYSAAECTGALLGGFRPAAYAGFAVGTVYQYVLLRLVIDFFFAEYPDMPEYTFDVLLMVLCLGVFIAVYEGSLALAGRRLTKVQIRQLAAE